MRQERTCDIDGCDRKTRTRGLCTTHYERLRQHGSPLVRLTAVRAPTCTVKGCDRSHMARGFCKTHYTRWRRHGDPTVGYRRTAPTPTVEERLATKWEFGPDGCWLWTGAKNGIDRYGYIRIDGRGRKAARVAYELAVEPIPPGMELDHLCFTPSCVNPDHLEIVTPAENKRRGTRHRERRRKQR